MTKMTKARFRAAQRRLGIKKVTKKNIGRISRAAWKGTGKSKSRSKSKTKTTKKRKSNPKGSVNRTGKKQFGLRQFISLGKKVALLAPGVVKAMEPGRPIQGRIAYAQSFYTGFDIQDGTFHPERLATGWGPYVSLRMIEKGLAILGKL